MSILPLVQLTKEEIGSKKSLLSHPCSEVKDFGHGFQKIVDDLVETFISHKIAVGLAAPQVGIPLRLAVININRSEPENMLIIVNPIALSVSGKKDNKRESCMSLPYYAGEVERRHNVVVAYQNRFGKAETLDAVGFLARAIAHEMDHLSGLLYVDRMKDPSELVPTDIFQND